MEQTGPQTTHPQLVDVGVALQEAGAVEEPRQRENTAAQPMQVLLLSTCCLF